MHPVIAPLSPIKATILIEECAETFSFAVPHATFVSGTCLVEDLMVACCQFYIFTGRRFIT